MADCRVHRERFSEYIDDVLDVQGRRALEEHLAGCAACRRELDVWRRLLSDVADLPVPPTPAGLTRRVLDRVEDAAGDPRRRLVRVFRQRVGPVAAMIAAVVGLTFAVNRAGEVEVPVAPHLALMRPYEAKSELTDLLAAEALQMDDAVAGGTLRRAVPSATSAVRVADHAGAVTMAAQEHADGVGPERDGVGGRPSLGGDVADTDVRVRPRAASAPTAPPAMRQFFNQLPGPEAVPAGAPVQQVLTLMAEDQAVLASRVVAVANDNGLQAWLALEEDEGGGAMDLYMSVPPERYRALLRQLQRLALPQHQTLMTGEEHGSSFFGDEGRRPEPVARGRAPGGRGGGLDADARAAGRGVLDAVKEEEQMTVAAEAVKEARARAEPAGALNLMVRVVRPAEE
ncbi:MAG: hypothetical protein GXY85_12200 [Candidatus Brocadiaceae bacterium]|nr:hypothetical protein [Candidatus Brocadiaceae bacterium]